MSYITKEEFSLLDQLQFAFPDASKTSLKEWILSGRVRVGGKVETKPHVLIPKGKKIELGKKREFLPRDVEVLYEDKDCIVLVKPINLLSVAADIEKELSVHRLLKERRKGKRVFPVHRLDKETSGVMVFAYTEAAKEGFKELFFHHKIERKYLALVEGIIPESSGTWQSYLYEDDLGVMHTTSSPKEAKLATTHFKKLGEGKNRTLLELKLETGRKNQIRIHAAESGHPIVGDKKYKATSNPYKRVMLHAQILGFVHPITKKALRFEVIAPEIFKKGI